MQVPFMNLRQLHERIKGDIGSAIFSVIRDSAFIGGKYIEQFEDEFASFCGAAHCIGVGNGTDALYIALRALGIGRGDQVITAANSFIATSEAITLTGASVVFVDCDPETYTLDINEVRSAIRPQTKAIVPVHLYGHPADMPSLKSVAEEHKLFLIEDAAQAHGAEVNGKRAGTLGHIGCFSFYPGKNLGAFGDAGALVTDDEELALRCRMIANHGRVNKYDHEVEGINSRLDGLQAAVLSVKLRHLEDWTEKRRALAATYSEMLKNSGVALPIEAADMRHVYHLYVVRVANRATVQSELYEKGISTGIHYPVTLPNQQAYKYLGHGPEDFPVATQYSKEVLSLPLCPELSTEQVEYVCDQLKLALTQ